MPWISKLASVNFISREAKPITYQKTAEYPAAQKDTASKMVFTKQ